MRYKQETKDTALKLFVAGNTLESIGKMDGMPSKQTLWDWYKKYNWEAKRNKATQKADDILDESLTDISLRQKQIARGLQNRLIRNIRAKLDRVKKNNKGEIIDAEMGTVNDLLNVLRHELLLEGKVTERMEISGLRDFLLRYRERRLKEKAEKHG